jgi:hypothetical protein
MRISVRLVGLVMICGWSAVSSSAEEPMRGWTLVPGKLFGSPSRPAPEARRQDAVETHAVPPSRPRVNSARRTQPILPYDPQRSIPNGVQRSNAVLQGRPETPNGTWPSPASSLSTANRKSWATTPRPMPTQPLLPMKSPAQPDAARTPVAASRPTTVIVSETPSTKPTAAPSESAAVAKPASGQGTPSDASPHTETTPLANSPSSADRLPSAATDMSPAVGRKPSVWTFLGLPKPKLPLVTFRQAKPAGGSSTPEEPMEQPAANQSLAVKKPATVLPETVLPDVRAAAEASPARSAYAAATTETKPATATPENPLFGSAKPSVAGSRQPTMQAVVSLEESPIEGASPAPSAFASGVTETVSSREQKLVESSRADRWPATPLPRERAPADKPTVAISPTLTATESIPPAVTAWEKPEQTATPRNVPNPELDAPGTANQAPRPSRHGWAEAVAAGALSQAKNALPKAWRGDQPAAVSRSKQPPATAISNRMQQVSLDVAPQPPALLQEWLTRPEPLAARNPSLQQPHSQPAHATGSDPTEKARQLLIATDLRAPQRAVQRATLLTAESETSEEPAGLPGDVSVSDPLELLSPKTFLAPAEISSANIASASIPPSDISPASISPANISPANISPEGTLPADIWSAEISSATPSVTSVTMTTASPDAMMTEPPGRSPTTPFTERVTFALPVEFAPSPTIVTPLTFASPAPSKRPVTRGVGDVDASDDSQMLPDATEPEDARENELPPLAPIFIELRGELLQIGGDESLISFRAVGEQSFQLGDEVQIRSDALDRRSTKATAKVIEVGDGYFIGKLTGIIPGSPDLRVGDGVVGFREGQQVQPE